MYLTRCDLCKVVYEFAADEEKSLNVLELRGWLDRGLSFKRDVCSKCARKVVEFVNQLTIPCVRKK
jgi:hypothetical protein